MSNLDFFKKQAKNLHKDWQTRNQTSSEFGVPVYEYHPKFFDVESIIHLSDYICSSENLLSLIKSPLPNYEENFSLMNAQHLIAKMVGFKKWNALRSASEKELLLAEIILRHFKSADDIQDWLDTLVFFDIEKADLDTKIKYARMYYGDYETGKKDEIKIEEPELTEKEINELNLALIRPDYNGLKLTSNVYCMRCGDSYLFGEAYVRITPKRRYASICCKNFPKCKGKLSDMWFDSSVDYGYNGSVPYDSDMDIGYVDDFE